VRRLLLLLLLLLPGCGLPLTEGVRSADGSSAQVPTEQQDPAAIQVLPPGPQEGASAVELVEGFLRAQSSPSDGYAVARQFLAPGTPWDAAEEAIVYVAASPSVTPDPERPDQVLTRLDTVASLSGEGTYRLQSGTLAERYTVGPDPAGRLRLTGVPPGLRLTPADRARSFRPYDLQFLGRTAGGGTSGRLVSDRVFLPVTADPAQATVQALLRGPTLPLQGAAASAVPAGTTLAAPVRTEGGVVTVDLSGPLRELEVRDRQRLSAQFVWTLNPAYTAVRLLVEGEPLMVEGAQQVQDITDWPGYDPTRLDGDAPLLYLQERSLRSLDGALVGSEITRGGGLPVDEAATSPLRNDVGLLTRGPDGTDEVRTGPLSGPFGPPLLASPDLGALSWGSGDQGLWVLQGGPTPVVWRVPGPDAPPGSPPQTVAYDAPPGPAGPLTDLRVSRDGARIALVFGIGPARRLHVGRIEPTETGLRITGVLAIAPLLSDVTDVAWESGVSLAVLAADPDTAGLLPVSVAVDGSSSEPVQRGGLSGTPVSLAAAPDRPLTVATEQEGRLRLFRDNGSLFRLQSDGAAPFYPG